ncbi:AraC family transcriptional regulator [Flavobacterium circumlabens]|uniref:AraC family transcriptional regulator n=1 Tax=Flavobacterium circumlabens TaxID=2133765 RepID=A0A4Y7U8K3_9FLAO|nr:AraC family transcriptional regulator [Flavobacterium circumlabens]TCN54560.1 AraC-like DNA-binding protein [Flavobacterium circumlabens]TEB42760.1 AraC family transcriptional regulator [Flavobacterium circumlabens]
MKDTFFIYKDFEIYSVEELTWKKEVHRHNFFELLYIEYGTGNHTLNSIPHQYKKHDIYLLTPKDYHSFKTLDPTKFHCLRFLPGFFSNKKEIEEIEKLFYYHNQTNGNLVFPEDDKAFCELLIVKILDEIAKQKEQNEIIIKTLMMSLIQIIRRNASISERNLNLQTTQVLKIDTILSYIRSNIANPHLLRKKEIANHFNVSVNYIGEYFKTHLNITLRDYIEQTKLKVVTEKLSKSNLTFSEISNDLGFIDSSHFNKFIMRSTGISPSEFKKALSSTS